MQSTLVTESPRVNVRMSISVNRPNLSAKRADMANELGGLSHQPCRALAFLAELELRLEGLADRPLGDQTALDLRPRRDLEHRVEKGFLDDRLQRARTSASMECELRDRVERTFLEHQLDVIK